MTGNFNNSLISTGIGIYKITHHQTIHIPKVEESWWGIGPPSDEDNSIEAFDISFPDEAIEDLRIGLKNVRPLPRPLENVGQSYGVNSHLTMRIVDYWLNKYNWKEREKYLNQHTHYKTKIQGLNIHFLHVKQKQENELKVIPLLLIHGWPSSIVEFYDIITHLTTPQKGYDFVFEVIAPSLPGYGFSDGASRPGLGVTQTSMILKNLMKRLNFERFLVAGGDWGAI
ncbi:hypothetical protein WA026_020934 [Henosepilachna vigintioctopunctata]|uniref:Epoxide hydrolase N-terminal domain-containing protein n=1 Tax=Henosepilachna vigintioctopunctata TaxID=420089 RepID=A0AAW1UPM6_9CUCU